MINYSLRLSRAIILRWAILTSYKEYETVLETGEYEVNGVNIFSRMADCSLQSGNYSDAISLFDEINEEEMNSEDYF